MSDEKKDARMTHPDSPLPSFSDLGVDEDICEALADLGYTEPTPIQSLSIRQLLGGYDLIGQSQTGSGKTAAFGLPLVMMADPDDKRLQGVVLCPTRELCMQAAGDLRSFLKYRPGIRVASVYGGQPIARQISDLKGGVQIIVGTPGRFLDHLRRHTIKLAQVQMVVLDEADEMLSMGFLDDVDLILSQMPEPRQTVLYSATMPEDIVALTSKYMQDPVVIRMDEEGPRTVDTVEQYYCEVRSGMKNEALLRLLSYERPSRALIFCNTKKKTAEVSEYLKQNHFKEDHLSGDMRQSERDAVMRAFREGEIRILTATDVAARGLDIDHVDLVINYDLPDENEWYVHRIGRTARAGRSGRAYTFVTPREVERLKELTDYTLCQISPRRLPTLQEIADVEKKALLKEVRRLLAEKKDTGTTHEGNPEKYLDDIRALAADGFREEEIACALLLHELYRPDVSEDELSHAPKRILTDREKQTMTRLYVGAGKKHHVRVKDLTSLIYENCGIPVSALGRIDLMDTFTYIEVPSTAAVDVIRQLDGMELNGRRLNVELAEKESAPRKKKKTR